MAGWKIHHEWVKMYFLLKIWRFSGSHLSFLQGCVITTPFVLALVLFYNWKVFFNIYPWGLSIYHTEEWQVVLFPHTMHIPKHGMLCSVVSRHGGWAHLERYNKYNTSRVSWWSCKNHGDGWWWWWWWWWPMIYHAFYGSFLLLRNI